MAVRGGAYLPLNPEPRTNPRQNTRTFASNKKSTSVLYFYVHLFFYLFNNCPHYL